MAYNYFESKQHLVESILELILELGSEYEKMVEDIEDPYEKLNTTLEYTFKFIKENEEFWRLYISFALQPTIMDTAKSFAKGFTDRMIKMITDIFKEIGLPNPRAEAFILGGIIDGISLEYFFDKENYPLKSVKKRVLERYSKVELNKLTK